MAADDEISQRRNTQNFEECDFIPMSCKASAK